MEACVCVFLLVKPYAVQQASSSEADHLLSPRSVAGRISGSGVLAAKGSQGHDRFSWLRDRMLCPKPTLLVLEIACHTMPRHSPFIINLSSDDRRRLEAISRKYTAPYMTVIRAKIVLLAADGWRNDQIAARLDMPRHVVGKWRKRFFEKRFDGLHDLPRHDGSKPSP